MKHATNRFTSSKPAGFSPRFVSKPSTHLPASLTPSFLRGGGQFADLLNWKSTGYASRKEMKTCPECMKKSATNAGVCSCGYDFWAQDSLEEIEAKRSRVRDEEKRRLADQKSAEKARQARLVSIPCAGCKTPLRFDPPVQKSKFRCPVCQLVYEATRHHSEPPVVVVLQEVVFQAPKTMSPEVKDAFEVLGLGVNAPFSEVKAAYRAGMKQYHPDVVSHLAPKFRELAEREAKELNRAFEILQKHFSA